MVRSRLYQTLCVIVVTVSIMSGSVTGVNLWSRIKQIMDKTVYKRELGGHNMDVTDPVHGVRMGIPNFKCDDGKHGIEIDWSPDNTSVYTCTKYELDILVMSSDPINIVETQLPAHHVCLKEDIRYSTPLPLNGDHRPLWPKFGEYEFLPPQRWVHSLEHGAIVFLYHPCTTNTVQLTLLKSLIKLCLTKYIIAPYRAIPHHMPFALLAFRHARLLSSSFGIAQVTNFVEKYALLGPETHVLEDGQYDVGLLPNHGVPRVTNSISCPKANYLISDYT